MGGNFEKLTDGIVFLLPTNVCNLKCEGCCTSLAREVKDQELSLEQYKELIAKCNENGYHTFDISGGEPFFRKDLIQILECIKSNKENRTIMVTNGTTQVFSDEELIKVLELTDTLRVSIDSHRADEHNRLRGMENAFEKSTQFLKKILRLKQENPERIQTEIGINYIWRSVDSNQLISIYQLANELKVDHLEALKYINFTGIHKENRSEGIFRSLSELVSRWKEQGPTVSVNLPSFMYKDYSAWRKQNKSNSILVRFDALGGCSRHLNNIVISALGQQSLCVTMLNFKELRNDTSWKNQGEVKFDLSEIKERLKQREAMLASKEPCKSCEVFMYCRGGCPVESLASGGSLDSIPAYCTQKSQNGGG